MPPGPQTIGIANEGADATVLDSVTLEGVRAVGFSGGGICPRGSRFAQRNKAVAYVTSPWIVYPAGALRYHPPQVAGQTLTLLGWPPGPVRADWFSPVDGSSLGSTAAAAAGGTAEIPIPDFNEDIVGVIQSSGRVNSPGGLQ